MKRFFTFFAAALIAAGMFPLRQAMAQAPHKMSYQAVVRDGSNQLITSTQVGLQIRILQGAADGTLVYEETQTPTTNANGLLTVEIGGQTGFDTIDWAGGPYFITTGIDPEGGTAYDAIQVTHELLTVPYALHAKTAAAVKGKHYVGELMGNNGEDGIVFWVDETGEHGLICSPDEIDGGTAVAWWNGTYENTGAWNQYDGTENTTKITAAQGDGSYAAKLCADYSTPGTSAGDWYLPAIDELSKLYTVKFDINKKLDRLALSYRAYWSSTETDVNTEYAFSFSFATGSGATNHKNLEKRVRAVRAF